MGVTANPSTTIAENHFCCGMESVRNDNFEEIIQDLSNSKQDFVDVVLIGGGHCNAQVIRDFHDQKHLSLNKIRLIVISNLDDSWYR